MGVAATLGDDSHGPDTVGIGLDACLRALADAGYRDVHYLTRVDGQVLLQSSPIEQVRPSAPR
jgi:histidinol-phosphatase (PHP family)